MRRQICPSVWRCQITTQSKCTRLIWNGNRQMSAPYGSCGLDTMPWSGSKFRRCRIRPQYQITSRSLCPLNTRRHFRSGTKQNRPSSCRDRPRPNDKRQLVAVLITIPGMKHSLWRAIGTDGDILDGYIKSDEIQRSRSVFPTLDRSFMTAFIGHCVTQRIASKVDGENTDDNCKPWPNHL